MTAEELVCKLKLVPHPEGGYYRETYRSAELIPAGALPARYQGARPASTAIYFMLTGENFSAFHRLQSDELWHFHAGDAIEAHILHPDGRHEHIVIGPDIAHHDVPQVLFPAGCWFGARMKNRQGFGLVGCTVAPGFDFADFELACRDELTSLFPAHAGLITSLTRS